MKLTEQIMIDFKQAFKDKKEPAKGTLSILKAEIKNQEIELKKREGGLKDEEVMAIIRKMIKQRKDSVEQFKQGGRSELVKKEEAEIKVLEKYLPRQMSEETIRKVVNKVIDDFAVKNMSAIGQIMGKVMGELKGEVDGNEVRKMVESSLKDRLNKNE